VDIGVEISFYPLKSDFAASVHEFVARLEANPRLRVMTNSMSTQVFGPYAEVMDALKGVLGASFAGLAGAGQRAVCVMKVFGPLAPA
jgi:uncharacterized protein YqgV (UPF0045/DUF77 family)